MRTVEFTSFPKKEQEIFKGACRRWNKEFDDFVVQATEYDPPAGASGPIRREVTVTYLPLRKARRYDDTARRQGWYGGFEDDLVAGFFRHP